MRSTARRISTGRVRWAAAPVAALLGAVCAFPSAASASTTHGADLVVRVKIHDLGTPPRILVGASGTAPRFTVVVTTTNQGDRAAGPSKTGLAIESGGLTTPFRPWKVNGLGPQQSASHTVLVQGLKPDLGFTEVRATADVQHVVPETHGGNNSQDKKIAVEPREWDVPKWMTEDTAFGVDNITQAATGFYLRFQKYDDGFVYQAFGPITDAPKSYPGCASVSGSKTITQTPWAGSIVKIDSDLKGYDGFVPTSSNSFMAACNVGGQSFPIQVGFVDLDTGPGFQKKDPQDTVLEGVDSAPAAGGGTTGFTWKFTAHVPKH